MSSMSKYKLRWQDYSSAFGSLRADKDHCDIRLVSEDAELVLAHRAVLSTCSIFFKALLGPNAVNTSTWERPILPMKMWLSFLNMQRKSNSKASKAKMKK